MTSFIFALGSVNCRRKEVALMLQNSPLCEKQTTGTLSRMILSFPGNLESTSRRLPRIETRTNASTSGINVLWTCGCSFMGCAPTRMNLSLSANPSRVELGSVSLTLTASAMSPRWYFRVFRQERPLPPPRPRGSCWNSWLSG